MSCVLICVVHTLSSTQHSPSSRFPSEPNPTTFTTPLSYSPRPKRPLPSYSTSVVTVSKVGCITTDCYTDYSFLMTYPGTTFLDTLRSSIPTSLSTSLPSIHSYTCTVSTVDPSPRTPSPTSPGIVEPIGCVRSPSSPLPLPSTSISSFTGPPPSPRDSPSDKCVLVLINLSSY